MPAFMMADVAVSDMQAYKDSGYLEATPKIAAKFGGRYRARGGEMRQIEGDWLPTRMIIIEFPNMDKLMAFVESEEYAPWRKVRNKLADSKVVALDGVDDV